MVYTWKKHSIEKFNGGGEMKNYPPRLLSVLGIVGVLLICESCAHASQSTRSELVYLLCYPGVDNFPLARSLGFNTVLVNLDPDGHDWVSTYEAAIQIRLKIIPLIWNTATNQSIWEWDDQKSRWKLDPLLYPNAVGAKFLKFLKEHPDYFNHTFAIYAFHEPLWEPDLYSPERMKKFYQQITEEVFPNTQVRVYGEDSTMGWDQSDECLTGVLDYENHLVYPFVNTPQGRYRPFDVKNNYWSLPPINDLNTTLKAELKCLDERLKRWAMAPAARTGRRPKALVMFQAFVDSEFDDLWNRMPTAEEMEKFAAWFLEQRGSQILGLAWYCFELVADNYRESLKSSRFDEQGKDRWEVMRRVSTLLN